ncbi:NUDIX domain-containing protein [Micromonospora sp. DT4]|uniref:NUDIX domain-containing protein n=1 Tax=Micromonospora sp. DT4 TaxID=3393438 RepID=UPI003CF67864
MTRRYASAGAVVATDDLGSPHILLLDQIRKTGERQTVAPKGRLEPGESPLQAAKREVAEEAGLTDTYYSAYLGQEAYTFTDNDGTPAAKTVDWFLFTTATTATTPARDEGFVQARWLEASAARQAASHPQFQQMLDRALAVITWHAAHPLPFSRGLSQLVGEVAAEAQVAIAGHPGAGIGLWIRRAGRLRRGLERRRLHRLEPAPDVGRRHDAPRDRRRSGPPPWLSSVTAPRGQPRGDARRLGALYDMKMQAVLCRVGLDTAVIAGAAPTRTVTPELTDPAGDLAVLHEFAVARLAMVHRTGSERADRRAAPG